MNQILSIVEQTKVCKKCNQTKTLNEFQNNTGKNHDSIASTCLICVQKSFQSSIAKRREEKLKNYVAPTERCCSKCHVVKLISEFNYSANHKDGIRPNCRDCGADRHKKWRQKFNETPEQRREYLAKKKAYNKTIGYYDKYFMKRFGITYADVKSMFDAQFGLCANRGCGTEIIFYHDNEHGRAHPNRACVDHDHTTGKVRALLCMSCNSILGTLETKENVVIGLLEYGYKFNPSKNSRLFKLTEKME